MKTPNFTLAQALQLIDYNPISGESIWKVSQGKAMRGDPVGTIQSGYKKLTLMNEQIKLHRLVWFLSYGVWPSGQIDHIDGNKLNNSLSNLRDVSMSVNMQNRYATKTKKSGLPYGVTFHPNGKFRADIRIGTFNTAEEASEAYMKVKRIIHEGCTR
jgi:hypothetical protein